MIVFLIGFILADAYLDGSLMNSQGNKPVQATGLCILLAAILIFSQLELAALIKTKGLVIFRTIAVISSFALATTWYWPQIFKMRVDQYLSIVLALTIMSLFFYQYRRFGTEGVVVNCGTTLFAIIYLGLLGSFFLAIRIKYGPWALLMFLFVVKSTDIGAYGAGTMWGKHKFSPNISPGKTWEGMAGAIVFTTFVSVLFSLFSGIMHWLWAIGFAVAFAFIGQLGDLAESMIKRDVQQKDSAAIVPGFGGLLDLIDSPIMAAPLAYLFFAMLAS